MRPAIIALLFVGGSSLCAQQTSVLFIGNSYTYFNDLPNTFRELALSLGDTVNVASSAPGGYTFQMHSTYAPTLTAIAQQSWDFVVLQEQSQLPSFPPEQVEVECYPYAAQLVDLIVANDSCSQAVFYMTWGRQNGDADNCDNWPPVCTYDGMQQRLRESYLQMAYDNDAFAAPVGVAWKHVRDTHPFINLYNADGSHPSPEGTYLAASVFYATLFRQSSVAATYAAAIDPDTAAILREVASATVLDSMGTWNIGVNDPNAAFTYTDLGSATAIFSSPGEGQDLWWFPNEPFSTESNPIHQFPGLGSWSVTHVVTDACGRSDTATQVVDLSFTGVVDLAWPEQPYQVWPAGHGGLLEVIGGGHGEWFTLMDPMGRLVAGASLRSDPQVFACGPGFYVWQIVSADGRATRKRLFIP